MAALIPPPVTQPVPLPTSRPNAAGNHGETRFVIGVDFGTTFTGVSWILTTGRAVSTDDIHTVMNWPGVGSTQELKVPSEYTYSATTGSTWGYGITDSQYVLRWIKLQLRPPNKYDALETLDQNLKEVPRLYEMSHPQGHPREEQHQSPGRSNHTKEYHLPRHLIKTPVDVVKDYMLQVAECVLKSIKHEKDPSTISEYPIDLVITHPAQWPETATNLTVKAVTEAFEAAFSGLGACFRDVFLATESDACAQITMKDATEDRTSNLRPGDSVVIVDAGGGTVDVISCKVQSINPFRIIPVTQAASGNCGSTCVDQYFLSQFLRPRLGKVNYHYLMAPTPHQATHGQGAHLVLRPGEQKLLDNFMTIKHRFQGPPEPGEEGEDECLVLASNIQDDPAKSIMDGILHITCDNLVEMFRKSVDGTLDLITKQILQLDLQGERRRAVFLSGGFSSSEYLFRCVHERVQGMGLNVIRAKESWTAVSKGAVLLGLGLGCDMPTPVIRCPFHIGAALSMPYQGFSHDKNQKYKDSLEDEYRAKDHIHWVVAKGDVINPTTGICKKVSIIRRITPESSTSGYISVVMSRKENEREIPSRLQPHGHDETITLKYDLQRAFDIFETTPRYEWTSRGLVDFARLHMYLDISVGPEEVAFQLLISSDQKALEGAKKKEIVPFEMKSIRLAL